MESLEIEDDLRNDIARSNFAGMLHDDERNMKYNDALKHVLHELHSADSSTHVLDIGTGTGILSMMAAQAGAIQVTACELFKPMAEVAERIISKNELSKVITVVNKNSTDLSVPEDMQEKADVLVTEIFDTELLGEGVLPTLRDAHKRLLKPNCQVIPETANVMVQLIESKKLWHMHKLAPENLIKNLPKSMDKCAGTAAPHELQISRLYPNNVRLLSEAESMTVFDFRKPLVHNVSEKCSAVTKEVQITQSGYVHGIVFWWDLVLHEGKDIVLSMEPYWMRNDQDYVWRDHWMQAVYYLKQPLPVEQGGCIFVKMFHDDYSIWFDISNSSIDYSVERPLCTCSFHVAWPRERFAMWNSASLLLSFDTLMAQACLNTLVIGDASLLPVLGNVESKLSYIECSALKQSVVKEIYQMNKRNQQVEILSLEAVSFMPDVVIFEPYFSSCLLPWHHFLRVSSIMKLLKDKVSSSLVFPQEAHLKACIVSLKELWKVRAPVGKVNNFDLSDFDVLIEEALSPVDIQGNFLESVEPFSMWEFEHELLSDATILAKFDFKHIVSSTTYSGNISASNCGIAHGIILWVDYVVDGCVVWTTGLNVEHTWVNFCRQGVYFIKNPIVLQSGHKIQYKVSVVPEVPDILFAFK